jgi:hypothetical protein
MRKGIGMKLSLMTCSFIDVPDVYLASPAVVYVLNPIFYLHLCLTICIYVGSLEDNVHLTIKLQLVVEAPRLFEDVVADLNVTVNYLPKNHEPLPQISDYVKSIRISLWDFAFFREFNAEKGVHKTTHLRSS